MVDPVVIPDEPRYNDASDRIYPSEYEGHFSSLMIKQEEIKNRTIELAKAIQNDYKGRRPVLLCILKGSSPFYNLLSEALQDMKQGYYMEFLSVSSYSGNKSTGDVKVEDLSSSSSNSNNDEKNSNNKLSQNMMGKDVIIVEDIIDTGTTLYHLQPILQKQSNPKSIEIVSLLSKRLPIPAKVKAKYVGFSIPNHFIVGFGLDYNELYRDVKDIWIISQDGIDFDQSTLL